jgi:ADP-heptose:LPS heptosyltransferase
MKTHTKIRIDAFFGRLIVAALNMTVRILGRFVGKDHSFDTPPRRIAVCKFLGMGSIIQATPLLQSLKASFPHAELLFITSAINKTLVGSIQCVDQVMCVDDTRFFRVLTTTFSLLKALWVRRPDLYIDLETYSYFSTTVATLSLSQNRLGFYRLERNIRLGVYSHMMFFNQRAPIAQSYLQMARLAGCRTIVSQLYRFPIQTHEAAAMRGKLDAITGQAGAPFIIINPNASDLRVERRWPVTSVIQLIQRLCDETRDLNIMMIGSSSEYEWVEEIYQSLDSPTRQKVFNTAGRFSMTELFALIHEAVMVVSNDTGPMHIAFALGRPTVSLFGPASPSQYGENPNAFGIYKNVYCSPCVHDFLTPPCRGDNQCMKQITVEEVMALCRHILSGRHSQGSTLINPMLYLKSDGKTSLGMLERKENKLR